MQLLKHFKELTVRPKNAQELKGLILQLAIQGKLTRIWREENPDIEPASALLKEVQKDKKQLIQDNKIKKEKSLTSIRKDEIPYEIPENWSWYKLAELSSINGGFAFKSTNYKEEGARVIRISDFDENGFKDHKIVRHSFTNDLDSYVLEDKNILIAMTGGTVGKSLFVDEVPEIMIVNQRVATIKIFKPIYEAYINCVIPTKLIQDVINEAKNSTNDNISMADIKGFKIPLPPLEEQKEIVKVVETLFKEVDQLEQLTVERITLKEDFVTSALNQLTSNNAKQEWEFLQAHFKSFFDETSNIKKLRETVLQLAVQGKLTVEWRLQRSLSGPEVEDASILLKRIQKEKAQLIKDKKIKKEKALPPITEDEVPYELPEGWVWCRMQDVFKDLRYGTSKKCDYNLGPHPVLRIPNIKQGGIDTADLKTTKLSEKEVLDLSLSPNDLLIIRSNGSESIVGRSAVVSDVGLGYSFAGYLVRLQVFKNHIESTYLHNVLESNMIRIAIEGPLRTTSGVKNINSTEISSLIIPIPPLEEQKAIVQKVNALMGLCDALEQEVKQSQEQSEQLMQSCLREVFEGKEAEDYKIEAVELGMVAEENKEYL